ncbi:MAG: class I SAM-dependent methyltransferase [Chloroflexi bacterium]|nr:class I SAM-dependent methyltransferase [Chloroflexota bacterium]
MHSQETPRYDLQIDVNSDSPQAKVVRLVGERKRVLELGCATGYMSRVLQERGCSVVAFEIDPGMAERAAVFCERIVVGDIEQVDLALELGEDSFDVIVAGDFLEHLKDPLPLLQTLRNYLRPEGYVVASVPNIAHASVRLALLGGWFPYSELGLLDRTHLRFFTRETIEKLFEDAGFAVGHIARQNVGIDLSEVPYDRASIPDGLIESLSNDPDALTYQFIIVAYPMPRAELGLIQLRILQLAEQREAAEREVGRLQQVIEEQREAAEREVGRLQQVIEEQREAAEREVGRLQQHIEKQTEHLEALTARLNTVLTEKDVLEAKLLDALSQFVQRNDEIQLFRERDARWATLEGELVLKDQRIREQQQYICDKEHHIADLQAALDRILYSLPGRIYRRLRSIVTLGRR